MNKIKRSMKIKRKTMIINLDGRRVKIQKTGTVLDGEYGTVSFYWTRSHKYWVIMDSRWHGTFKFNQLELV